ELSASPPTLAPVLPTDTPPYSSASAPARTFAPGRCRSPAPPPSTPDAARSTAPGFARTKPAPPPHPHWELPHAKECSRPHGPGPVACCASLHRARQRHAPTGRHTCEYSKATFAESPAACCASKAPCASWCRDWSASEFSPEIALFAKSCAVRSASRRVLSCR